MEISHIRLKNLFWGQPWFHRPLLATQWIIRSEVSIILMGIILHQSRGYNMINLRGPASLLTSSDARHEVSAPADSRSAGANMSPQTAYILWREFCSVTQPTYLHYNLFTEEL